VSDQFRQRKDVAMRPLGRRITTLAVLTALGGATASTASAAVHGLGALPPTQVVAPHAPAAAGGGGFRALTVPASVDLTAWAPPVGNQGSVGSCVGWAFAHTLAGWYANRGGLASTAFAPMFLYTQINGGVDNGAQPTAALRAGRAAGNVPSASYPQGDYDWSTTPTAAEFAIGTHYRFADPEVLAANGAGGMGTALTDAIKSALAANQPVAIEFPVRPGFDNLSPSNTLDTDTTGAIRGYHEVIALGYDANGLLIENQWGTAWGSSGFGRIGWNVVQQDVVEADTISGLQRSNVVFPDGANSGQLKDWTFNTTLGWQQTTMAGGVAGANTSASPTQFHGDPYVFYHRATSNTVAYAHDSGLLGTGGAPASAWSAVNIGGDTIATGSSPSAVNLNGRVWVFYVDASKSNTLAAWSRGPSDTAWQSSYFYGHTVASGTSPSAVLFGGTVHVLFVDASAGNTVSDWYLGSTWTQVSFSGHAVASGASLAPVVSGGALHIFFSDATALNSMAVWRWAPTSLTFTNLYGHAVASGTTPSAIDVGGTPHTFFVDASNNNTISDWNFTASGGWQQVPLYGHGARAGTSPGTLYIDNAIHVFFSDSATGNSVTDWDWEPSSITATPFYGQPVAAGAAPVGM
jgi:hypothetical protein